MTAQPNEGMDRCGPRILFLDKVFLESRDVHIRGVEVFNLNLIRDLSTLGCDVTVPAHESWHDDLTGCRVAGMLEIVPCRAGARNWLAGVGQLWRWRQRQWDVFVLGNVANRLIPAILAVGAWRLAPRSVVIAHREPSRRYLWAQRRMPTRVLAVNRTIARHFEKARFESVAVFYGITNADRFLLAPLPPERSASGDLVNFCVLGHLDSAWKGADVAVETFRQLPESVRARSRLHLASYAEPPSFGDSDIMAYAWMPFDDIPAFLRRMDVMLVPSRDEGVMRETFSQAMVQGMLTGLPIVANDLPILAEKLGEGGA